MRWPVRCRRCGTRHTLPLHPDHYYRRRRCRCCGALGDFRVDVWMQHRDTHAQRCTDWRCLYLFPHRKGSKFCTHYGGRLTQDEIDHYYAQRA